MSLSEAWSARADKQAIEDAVAAERERCAKIAESMRIPLASPAGEYYTRSQKEIAAAIRSGE